MNNLIAFVAVANLLLTITCNGQLDLGAEKTEVKTVVDQFAQV